MYEPKPLVKHKPPLGRKGLGALIASEKICLAALDGLSQGANSARGKTKLHPADTLGLKIDLKLSAGGDVRVTAGISRCRSSSAQLTYSAHKIAVEQLQK